MVAVRDRREACCERGEGTRGMSNNDREDPPIPGGLWMALGALAFIVVMVWAVFRQWFR